MTEIMYHKCELCKKQEWFRIYQMNGLWYLEDSKSEWVIVKYCPFCGVKL